MASEDRPGNGRRGDDGRGDEPEQPAAGGGADADGGAGSGPTGAVDVPVTRHPVPRRPPGEPEILAPEVLGPYRPVRPAAAPFLAWWARPATILVVAAVVLVLLISTTVFATLALSGDSAAPPVASPSPSPSTTTSPPARTTDMPTISTAGAGATPGAPGGGTPAAPGLGLPPTPSGPGVPAQSGTYETDYPGPNRGFDFDDNDDNVTVYGSGTDIAITAYGLTGVNGVGLARHTTRGRPDLADCTGIAAAGYVLDVPAGELRPGLTLCLYTTYERYGYLTVLASRHNNSGLLDGLTFNFLLWEGPND